MDFFYGMIHTVIYYYPILYKYAVYLTLVLLMYVASFVNRAHIRTLAYRCGTILRRLLDKCPEKFTNVCLMLLNQTCNISNAFIGLIEGIERRNTQHIVTVRSVATITDIPAVKIIGQNSQLCDQISPTLVDKVEKISDLKFNALIDTVEKAHSSNSDSDSKCDTPVNKIEKDSLKNQKVQSSNSDSYSDSDSDSESECNTPVNIPVNKADNAHSSSDSDSDKPFRITSSENFSEGKKIKIALGNNKFKKEQPSENKNGIVIRIRRKK